MTAIPRAEPLRTTLFRTGTIAIVAGAIFAQFSGGFARWPAFTLLMLWPALGGHWVELWFLKHLRPHLPDARALQVLARLSVWFVAGVGIAACMGLTATLLLGVRFVLWPLSWAMSWRAGLAFVGIELVVHSVLQLTGRSSAWNGRG